MLRQPLRPAGVAVGLFLLAAAAAASTALATTHGPAGQGAQSDAVPPSDRSPPGTLGQIPEDYELHAELILVSGQLDGFAEHCGFGRHPDRAELLDWYRHYRLARNMARIESIYDLGVSLGHEAPCTAQHYRALAANWDRLLSRTRSYVEAYRQDPPLAGTP